MEKQRKVSFSIPTHRHRHRRRLINNKPPACFDDEGTGSRSTPAPAPQFIAEFGGPSSSETATPTPIVVVAPLRRDREQPYYDDGSSLKPTIIEEAGIVFTSSTSTSTSELDNHPRSSSHHAYGLNLPTRAPADKKPHHQAMATSSSELLRRRPDISDHRDTEEVYPNCKFSAAAVLAGYGWSEGQGIGRNNKEKGDTKVFTCGRRPGTGAQRQTFGLGYNPVEISGAGKKRKRQDTSEQVRIFSMRPT